MRFAARAQTVTRHATIQVSRRRTDLRQPQRRRSNEILCIFLKMRSHSRRSREAAHLSNVVEVFDECLFAVGLQFAQTLAGLFQFIVLLGEAETQQVFAAAGTEEGRAGNRGYACLREQMARFLRGSFAG